MWNKEAPREVGFYWLRFVWQHRCIVPDRTPFIVHVVERGNILCAGFPGNEDVARPLDVLEAEWWSDPIRQPSTDIELGKAEMQRAAGLRTIAKPGEPGYLLERAEHS